jgi:hypothetical protein
MSVPNMVARLHAGQQQSALSRIHETLFIHRAQFAVKCGIAGINVAADRIRRFG